MDYPPEYAHVFHLLDRVRYCRGHWQARCPAHDDRHPSLTISLGRDRLILHCHAGCPFTAVYQALCARAGGNVLLLPHNGREEKYARRPPERRVVAVYDYRDEGGRLLFQTVRYHPKDFRQRRPNPSWYGGQGERRRWLWDLSGVRRVLYRLPDLAAADPGRWVLVLEGEKDCEAARLLGVLATCNVGGATKFHLADVHCLAGRRVAVVPDLDVPDPHSGRAAGLEHALQVVNRLDGLAAEVRLVFLPLTPGHDFSDWLAGVGGGVTSRRHALWELVRRAPAWTAAGPTVQESKNGQTRSDRTGQHPGQYPE